MSGLDLRALREAAEAATPGPWEYDAAEMDPGVWSDHGDRGIWVVNEWNIRDRDASFIAAANPTAILALIERVEAAEGAVDDERAAKRIAADSADRFRDALSECLGYEDENPGDDVLVRDLREHFGKTGPEPTRWRDFLTGARAKLDQINADRAALDGDR